MTQMTQDGDNVIKRLKSVGGVKGTIPSTSRGMGPSVQQIERLMGTRGDIIRKCPPPSAR